MPDIPKFNMSAIGPVVGALWETAKSSIPSKCKEMAGSGQVDEQTNFAKFGGPQNKGAGPNAGCHEMSDLRKTSNASSDDFCGGESGHKGVDVKINEWEAAWNVTNAIQGMFILSLPFGVVQGGYWAIIALIGVAHICCYTGKILVECLYEEVDVYENDELIKRKSQQAQQPPPRPPPPQHQDSQMSYQQPEYQGWDDGPQQTTEFASWDDQPQQQQPQQPQPQGVTFENDQQVEQVVTEPMDRGQYLGKRKVRVRDSYVAIARDCLGRTWGRRFVHTAQLIELLMTCILYVVVCGDLMRGVFPGGAIDSRSWMMLCGILLVPLGFLKSLHTVSLLSFWCTMAHLVINVVILGYCFLQIGSWGWSEVRWSIDMRSFPVSLGVIVFSYTSQIFLPSLEGNMIDPSKFEAMLNWSHIAAAVFKSLFAYMCFLTFQYSTYQEVTNNLPSAGFKGFVNFFLVAKAILSYPLPYYAACELLERALFRGRPKTYFPTIWALDGELKVWGLAFRVGVVVFTILLAIFVPHFSILMGFIGNFTGTMLSFIWPCYFHLRLKKAELEFDPHRRYYNYFIISLGCLFATVGIYTSIIKLNEAFSIGLPF